MKWPLIASLILPWLLVYLGFHIVQRGVIFVDLALAQMAAFGTCASMLFGYDVHDWQSFAFSMGFTLFGAVLVSTVTILNNRAPKELASTYQGILSAACWGLAPLIGGPVSDWVYQTAGPLPFFLGSAVMALLGAALLLPTYRLWSVR